MSTYLGIGTWDIWVDFFREISPVVEYMIRDVRLESIIFLIIFASGDITAVLRGIGFTTVSPLRNLDLPDFIHRIHHVRKRFIHPMSNIYHTLYCHFS